MAGDSGWVVGLNHGGHDASCALLYDGRLVAVIEQERLSRRKRALEEAPVDALRYCLDHAGIRLSDVSVVALGSDHDDLAAWLGLSPAERSEVLPYDDPERLFPREVFGHGARPPIEVVRHHVAHAASCFWPSGFEESAVLVMDAMGESTSTTLAYGDGAGIKILESHPVEASLGFFYEAAAEYTGLGREHAGKFMGLAAYGRPGLPVGLRYEHRRIDWPVPVPEGLHGRELIEGRMALLRDHFRRGCFPYTEGCVEDVAGYANFAASVQACLSDVVLGVASRLRDLTGSPNLVIAGGVGLNCSANGDLVRAGLFERVYVQPMAHDAGVSIGAACAAAAALGHGVADAPAMEHAYWGAATDETEVEAELRAQGLLAERLAPEDLVAAVAELIVRGGIVAWHQGRGEVGPRALGARSLLGDPRTRRTLVRMNQAKRREMWRPLAPSVLTERFDTYFEGVPNPFMIVAATVRPEVRPLIPAVVHVDGTSRPQAVDRVANRLYASLLERFEAITGVPILVNTSLNVAGEPLAAFPADSIRAFHSTGADALAIGPFLVRR